MLQKCKALEALNSIFQNDDKKAYKKAIEWETKIKELRSNLNEKVKNLKNEHDKELNSLNNKNDEIDLDFMNYRSGITNELSVRDVLQNKFKD